MKMTNTITLNITSYEMYEDEMRNMEELKKFQKETGFTTFFEDMEKEIISGDFIEGGTVTVKVDGKEYTRKVKYSAKQYADLYITIKGYVFTYSDFYTQKEW